MEKKWNKDWRERKVVVFEKSWEKEDEYNLNVLDKILKDLNLTSFFKDLLKT